MNIHYSLGPLEQEIMFCLWQDGNKKVSDVHNCLKKKRKIAYTTVMTVMTRLVEKGLLTRKKAGRVYLYFPRKSKKQTARDMVRRVFSSLTNQFGREAIIAFSDELKRVS